MSVARRTAKDAGESLGESRVGKGGYGDPSGTGLGPVSYYYELSASWFLWYR